MKYDASDVREGRVGGYDMPVVYGGKIACGKDRF